MRMTGFLNCIVAALWLAAVPGPAHADRLTDLFAELQQPDQEAWGRIERQIVTEWSRSGSASADLLLQRGRRAMAQGDVPAAIEHLTALTDHAPDFAEGYNARATAYFRQGLYGLAIADIARVLELNPMHFGALAGLGTILEEVGRDERALAAYRAAQAIHPHQPAVKTAVERLELQITGQAL